MFKKLFEKFMSNKKLAENYSYLTIFQSLNIIIPFFSYPYLIRVLGTEYYGLVIFAQAIVSYFVILISYGFNFSAVKEISINRDDPKKVSEIFSSVMIIKSAMVLLAFLILYISLYFIPAAENAHLLFYLTMWLCIYDLIFPVWYFQGIEKMKFMAFISLTGRLSFLVLVFVFIKEKNDYLYVPLFNMLTTVLIGIISLYIIFVHHKVEFVVPSWSRLKYYFNESTPIFLSNLSLKIYGSANKVLIGAFLGMTEMAYYDLAEKIIIVMRYPQNILTQTLFPKISHEKNIAFIKKTFKAAIIVNGVIFIATLIFSKYIVLILGGEMMLNAVLITNLLAITIPLVAINSVFGIQVLIPFGQQKYFSLIIIYSGILYILMAVFLYFTFGYTLISITFLTIITEFLVAFFMYFYCKKLKLW